MSMDSAMDSLSTTSEHSIASSTESPANIKQPHSPQDHRLQQQQQQHQQEQQQQQRQHLQEQQQQQQRHNQEQRQQHQATSLTNHSGSHRSSPPGGNPNSNSNQTNINNNRTPTPVSPIGRQGSSPLGSIGPHMMPMPHPLSPPQVSTPNSIAAMPRMPHLPPHGLGLLNSLQMMHHANPLELMAVAHHHVPPRSYNSPPPISTSDPTANECKLVDYRGQKVAAFIIAGDTMLCLPQAFELFLKHLVGGLHTVYTKLKRLDIVPLVCNVEQVRILRGLGAIQPGVNRCKLLSCKDFDILYRDCTTASSRPGRPPKRGPVGLSLPATTHLSHHPQLKKHRLDNGDYPYENGHLGDISRLEKSPLLANGYNPPPTHLNHMQFMQMNHHPGAAALMSPGMPPHGIPRPDGPLMKGQPGMQGMEAIARSGIWENCRAAYEDIVKHLERLREERGDDRVASMDQKPRDLSSHNGSSNGQSPVLNLSKSGMDHSSHGEQSDRSDGGHSPVPSVHDDEDNMSDENVSDVDDRDDKDEDGDLSDVERDLPPPPPTSVPSSNDSHQQAALNYSSLAATAAAVAASGVTSSGGHPGQEQNLSSTETLLRNIQSLLKVAADNARQQERQITYEKAELKMDVLREREVKDSLERQLSEEQKLRGLYQKRFKKERRVRMRLQQQIDCEMKRRQQLEDALKASGGPAEALRLISENTNNDRRDRSESSDSRRPDSPYAPPGRPEAPPQPPPSEGKPWNYSGLDLMATGAFWQNYSESLAQELELERKARQQANEQDVKSPLQDRPNYYKNSVLFSSAT